MEILKNMLIKLGSYSGPIFLLLIEVLIALVLMNGFILLNRKKRKRNLYGEGENIYRETLENEQQEVRVLFRISDMKVVFATENLQQVLGVERENLCVDVRVLEQILDWKQERNFLKLYNSWDKTEPLLFEFSRKDGQEWMQMSLEYVKDRKYGLICFRNITENKKIIFELEEQLKSAEETSEYKSSFLSDMSHEIRTPMNGILGMMALAKKRMSTEEPAFPYIEKAEEVSQHLLSLINDILDMSRIEAGKIELEESTFDLFSLEEKLRSMFQKTTEAKGVAFDVRFVDFDVRYVKCDELRLSQVLINLLSNAVKFTNQGEVSVIFKQMMRDEDSVSVMIRVHDTGKGMKPEFVSKIFHPFEQESASVTKEYGGSGLGMAITDQLVRLMGGEVVIDTMPGKGSDFSVFLTLKLADEEMIKEMEAVTETFIVEAEEYSYEGKHILLAEDNELNAEIAVSILEESGAIVKVAENGQDAVDKFAASSPNYFDFILMDIQMPILDGREATKAIRKLGRADARKVIILALSADAFVEDKRYSKEVGMDGHFAKPINFEEVRTYIGRLEKERAQ